MRKMDDDRPLGYERGNRPKRSNWLWPVLVFGLLLLGIWGLGAVANTQNFNLGNPPGGQQPGIGGGPDITPTSTLTPTPTPQDENLPQLEDLPASDSI